jgi:hypothetical protein
MWKFLGVAVAALTVAVVVPVMDNAYHFLVPLDPSNLMSPLTSNTDALPAPQANMLAAIVKGMMTDVGQPYLLYGLGGLIAVLLVMAGVPPLAFSLGMYLPISINLAVLFGAAVSWVVGKVGPSPEVRKARSEQGTLIASGVMAGAAIFGIIAATLRVDWNELFGTHADFLRYPIRFVAVGVDFVVKTTASGATYLGHAERLPGAETPFYESAGGQVVGLLAYVALGTICFFLARWGAAKDAEERGQRF